MDDWDLEALRGAKDLIVPPKQEHKQTFIILHGRGDRAATFGTGLLCTALPDDTTLQQIYPNTKFVFLCAPLRRLAANPEMKFYQWFDVWSLLPGSEEDPLQISGLQETVHLVHGTLRQEIELIGAANVVLGGLSQGCASSLISLLLWDGPPFLACFGMCGWLPFRKFLENTLMEVASGLCSEQSGDDERDRASPQHAAIAALGKKFGYSDAFSPPTVYQQIPVFLGHGTDDETIAFSLGLEASSCLTAMLVRVHWKEYRGLRHWYSPEMLHNIVEFLQIESLRVRTD